MLSTAGLLTLNPNLLTAEPTDGLPSGSTKNEARVREPLQVEFWGLGLRVGV